MANFPGVAKQYLQLLRASHWIKNFLIFIPVFFNIHSLDAPLAGAAVLGFICFSLLSSVVYILNDFRDIEKDRLHSVKRFRPLASGKISIPSAFIVLAFAAAGAIASLFILRIPGGLRYNLKLAGLPLLYLLSNIGYSWGLKNIPIVDITILALGYVIRVVFGALIIGVDISVWLYLVITMGAYYLGLGKRRNEMDADEKGKRTVLRFYSHDFLDKNMYVCQTLCVVFYALWSIDPATVEKFNSSGFVYTIPFILIILFKYSLAIETNADGDPVSVLLKDKLLLVLCAAYIACAFCILYFSRVVP